MRQIVAPETGAALPATFRRIVIVTASTRLRRAEVQVRQATRTLAPSVAAAPPRLLYRLTRRLRELVIGLSRRLAPAPVVLYEQLTGVWHTEMIYVAARLELADRLADGPQTASALAAACGADADALARLLRALVASGLFVRDGEGRYDNNRLSATLRRDAPDSMRDIVLYGGSAHSMQAWSRFFEVVESGTNGYQLAFGQALFDYLATHPDERATFNGAMVCLTRLELPALARGYDYGALARICDVGGGRGTLMAAILSLHPALQGVVFDDAQVVAEAGPLLARWGVAERCATVGGSFFAEVPGGCDAYILKEILHDWADDDAVRILTACRQAMKPGARLLVMEMLIVEDGRSHPATLLDLQMLTATHDGRQRSRADFERLFARAGLRLRRVIDLATPSSIVEAEAMER